MDKVIKSSKDKKNNLTYSEIGCGLGLTEEQVGSIITANKELEDYEKDGFVLSGNVVVEDNVLKRAWCRAGQTMVESIEFAAKYLKCPEDINITGEYLIGKDWASCH